MPAACLFQSERAAAGDGGGGERRATMQKVRAVMAKASFSICADNVENTWSMSPPYSPCSTEREREVGGG